MTMDLTALRDYLRGRGSPLVLAPSDTNLPQELRAFLNTMPNQHVTLMPDSNGVALDGSRLSVAGACSDSWPVQGMAGVSLALSSMTITIADNGGAVVIDGAAHATLPFAPSVHAPVIVTAQHHDFNPWQIKLAGDVAGATPTELLLLGKTGTLPFDIPPDLDVLGRVVAVKPEAFEIIFYPNTTHNLGYTFSLSVPEAQWTIIDDVLAFDGIDIRTHISTLAIFVELIGHPVVGRQKLDVGIGMDTDDEGVAFIRPSEGASFPGLGALAEWIGKQALAGDVSSGFANVNFNTSAFDLAISELTLGFNWSTFSLTYLDIRSLLTVGALHLDVLLRLPDIQLSGSLYRNQPIKVKDMLASFELPTDAVPDDLSIVEVRFAAEARTTFYMAEMKVDNIWSVGPVKLEEVGALVVYDALSGFTGQFECQMAVGSAFVAMTAQYEGAEVGWRFAGALRADDGVSIGDLLAALADSFGITSVPEPIKSLSLTYLSAAYETKSGKFNFSCAGGFSVDQAPVEMLISIDVTPTQGGAQPGTVQGSKGYSASFNGQITMAVPIDGAIHHLRFDLHFVLGSTENVFVAAYSHAKGDPVPTVKDVVHAFSPATAEHIPDGIAVDIRDVVFAFVKAGQATTYLFGVDIDATIDLSRLPLVGERLAQSEVVGVNPLQLLVASAELPQTTVAMLNGLIPTTINKLPDRVLPQGFTIGANLQLGSFSQPLALPVANKNGPVTPPPATPTQAQTDDKVLWYKIQRNFGPLHFERVGFQYQSAPGQKAELLFLLDAALSAAGLTLALEGLSVGLSLADLAAIPSFSLRGLGIDYKGGPVEIGGSFLKSSITYNNKSYTAYSGRALLKAETLTIGAIGSYIQLDEGPSLFVYAFLDYPIGGPAFFFVRGLAAGFGYNRRLIAPAVDRIADFPLVQEASGQMQAGSLADELRKLQDYLPPSIGDYFLAVGIRFTSFEMIDSFVLLTVAFGHRFELNVLGLSTMILPAPDAASAGVTPLAEIQLALRATLVPDDGFFGISAQLTQNSYLLSRDCHLTGGFAFYSWFGDQHPGDFVLTVGGYHPRFTRPDHYPVVPRLGFNWQVDANLLLKGSAYYALTPSMLMAGGSLSATWESGNLKAWFDASMDFLIAWKPFHYEADFHISVGASYTYHFFGTHQITAHVGADVSIWGPEFSGTAYVDLTIVSFTISFIKSPKDGLKAIDWQRFRESFLPEDSKICTITIRGGLAHQDQSVDDAPSADGLVMINPHELVLATDSLIPSKNALRGEAKHDTALPVTGATLSVGVGPMGQKDVDATHRILITYGGDPADDWFEYRPATKSLPFALWGGVLRPALNNPQLVADMLTGYEIRPKAPLEPSDPPTILRSALQSATPLFTERDAFGWSALAPFVPQSPSSEVERERLIDQTIDTEQVRTRRTAIAGALIADAALDLAGFDAGEFLIIPQVSDSSPA
jgi:hypothetical protein